jgi:hypothetical protein
MSSVASMAVAFRTSNVRVDFETSNEMRRRLSDLWVQTSLNQKQRLQQPFFP